MIFDTDDLKHSRTRENVYQLRAEWLRFLDWKETFGRARTSSLELFTALCRVALIANRLEVTASIFELMENTGYSKQTVVTTTKRLIDAGIISKVAPEDQCEEVKMRQTHYVDRNVYRLNRVPQYLKREEEKSQIYKYMPVDMESVADDAWTGKGTAMWVYMVIKQGPVSARFVASVIGISKRWTLHQIQYLREHGLVVMNDEGLYEIAEDKNPEDLAASRGTLGSRQMFLRRVEELRRQYHDYMAYRAKWSNYASWKFGRSLSIRGMMAYDPETGEIFAEKIYGRWHIREELLKSSETWDMAFAV